METDILNSVIEAERQIQERLDEEKKKSRLRIEGARSEADDEIARQEKQLKQVSKKTAADAKAEIQKRSAEIIRHAESRAEANSCISDEALRAVVERHISRILPEE